MSSIYDDDDLTPEVGFPDNVTFTEIGDRVRGRIERMEKLQTKYGQVAKYWLFDLDRNVERTMLAGARDLWTQLYKMRPAIGDVVEIELVRIEGRMYFFSVQNDGAEAPGGADEPF